MGIKNDQQKKRIIIFCEIKHLEFQQKYIGKIVDIFCKMLLIPYNNIYYDYWDLITKFWLGSTK